MEAARRELERTDRGLKQVAAAAGFGNVDLMRRAFVRLLGITPKRYRELSGIRKQLLRQIRQERPAAFIGVDAPDFNLWLEGKVRDAGIPAIHFVTPSDDCPTTPSLRRLTARMSTRTSAVKPYSPPRRRESRRTGCS